MLDVARSLVSIASGKRSANWPAGQPAPLAAEPPSAGFGVARYLVRYTVHRWQPFVELRSMRVQGVDLPIPGIADIHGDIGRKWDWFVEMVLQVKENGISPQRSRVGAYGRNDHQIGGILNQLGRVAMIGMIVVGAVGEDDIRPPIPNLADDIPAGLNVRDQLSVMMIEQLGRLDAQSPGRLLGFRRPQGGEFDSTQYLMPGVAVGHGQELYGMSKSGEFGGCSAELKFAVVRVCSNAENPEMRI